MFYEQTLYSLRPPPETAVLLLLLLLNKLTHFFRAKSRDHEIVRA